MNRINLVILEPSFLIRKGLVAFFREFRPINLIHDSSNLNDALDFIKNNPVEIIAYSEDFVSQFSNKSFSLKYIITHDKTSNGDGILNILNPKEQLVEQVEKDLNQLHPKTGHDDDSLSEREIEVLALVAEGATNKEIADKLFISVHTVITHRKNITHKLGIKTVSGLTLYAILNNLLAPMSPK